MPKQIPEKDIGILLKKQNLTLAIAESCTGGYLSHRITNSASSSKYFKEGIIAYSNQSKIKTLKIPERAIKTHTAVSRQVASLMAESVRRATGADIGLGITGAAGPERPDESTPVGLVYIALSVRGKIRCYKFHFGGSRIQIKRKASQKALQLLESYLRSQTGQNAHIYRNRL